MISSQKYFIKNRLENEFERIIEKHVIEVLRYENKVCFVCGVKQGQPLFGFEKFYCEHITKRVENKLKKEKKELSQKAFIFDFLCG